MIQLIVTDLDNTLLNDNKEVSVYSAKILKTCQEKGIKCAFATARPERATKNFQTLFQPDYVISNNGATISHGENVIYNNVISADIRNKIMEDLVSREEITCLTAETGEFLYINYDGEAWEIAEGLKDSENWNTVYNDFKKPLDKEISKISIECKDAQLVNQIISKYPSIHLYHNSGEDWSQAMHKDSTKMNGIRYLAEVLGIPIENIVAFGDDFNDIDMLKYCGIGVAVDNAASIVKEAADDVCQGNYEDGVAKWIERNIHGNL